MPRRGAFGFSLVEVILAIGIFGFAVVTILGLMSSMLGSSRESWQETRAAQIARQILSDLQPAPGETQGRIQTTTNSSDFVNLGGAADRQVSYTMDGLPVASGEPSAFFQTEIKLSPITNAPDAINARTEFSDVRISIKPIDAGANFQPFQFSSRIAPKVMQKP